MVYCSFKKPLINSIKTPISLMIGPEFTAGLSWCDYYIYPMCLFAWVELCSLAKKSWRKIPNIKTEII